VSPPTLMHSRFAGPQAGAKGKGKAEGPGKAASGPRVAEARKNNEGKAKGWTTVERRRRGGPTKGTKEAKIVDGRGVASFWSTPEGLYKSWRWPIRDRREDGTAFNSFFFCFFPFVISLVGSGAASR